MEKISLIDLDILQEAKTIMKTKFPAMVGYFLEDSEGYISVIREAIAANKVEQIIAPAHTLKSSSVHMGVVALSNIAKWIEEEARKQAGEGKNDINSFLPQFAELEKVFAETKNTLPAYAA